MNASHVQSTEGGVCQTNMETSLTTSQPAIQLVRNIHSSSFCIAILDKAYRGPCQVTMGAARSLKSKADAVSQ